MVGASAGLTPPMAMVMPAGARRAEASVPGPMMKQSSSEELSSRGLPAFFKSAGLVVVRRGGG